MQTHFAIGKRQATEGAGREKEREYSQRDREQGKGRIVREESQEESRWVREREGEAGRPF
ncbi:hypothetical protein E2C01_011433 [Portunus trituberculatus]|uniref:Uncharacterized protein n=1 Tax=Portunus trituberculatus TaxID=210409 RepID=A0A5B7DBP8_PORTR|nr:hypothetical protein [Portunus trituberculatus]